MENIKIYMNNKSCKMHNTISCATRHGSNNYKILTINEAINMYPKASFCKTCMKEYFYKFNLLNKVA